MCVIRRGTNRQEKFVLTLLLSPVFCCCCFVFIGTLDFFGTKIMMGGSMVCHYFFCADMLPKQSNRGMLGVFLELILAEATI